MDKEFTFTESDLQKTNDKLIANIFLYGLPFLIYAIVELIKNGYSVESLIVLLGSIFSTIGSLTYAVSIQIYGARNKKSWWALLLVPLGFIPYIFGCYLCFYMGFWKLIKLFSNFSFWGLVLSLASIIFGYLIVRTIWKISEIGRAISDKRIKITNN